MKTENTPNASRRLVTIPDASKASGMSQLQIQSLVRKGVIGRWWRDGGTRIDFIELTIWTHRNEPEYKRMLKEADDRE
ncbi:MAG: hypothetical protein K2L01_01415 [Rikenellaceae bacterium]|nr:hypothetical protein [Rikenellaceae bacterium]